MNTITIDRALVEQALEELEYHVAPPSASTWRTTAAITALRAALAQQAAPELRRLHAQRDALLEALKDMLNAENDYLYGGMSESEISAIRKARAAIKAVEEGK